MLGAATLPVFAQQGLDNPMTRAMMEVYDKELASNPDNAEVLFRRANEYYRFNQYLRALADADGAIKNAPANDRDFRAAAYQLRGEIYQMLEKYSEALADFTESLKADPSSFMALYQKANCEFELGDYAAAKADYTRLRAHNQRGVEALTGLARVAVKENNLGIAQGYMDDAVAMMPADSDIYVRRASVRRAMGNNTGAVDDLVMAISIDSNNRAFQELVKPYLWGAVGPASYDCSGLVSYCLTGQHVRLGTTDTFQSWTRVVAPQPGDITLNSHHCGIYIGNGQMIHAPRTGDVVKISAVHPDMIYVRY